MSNSKHQALEISVDRLSLLSEENKKIIIDLIHGLETNQSSQPNIGVNANIASEKENLMTATEGVPKAKMHNVRPGYEELGRILAMALEQAQNGKGNARHQIGDTPFVKQPICELGRLYGTGYNFGQAAKKAHETNQLGSKEAKVAELLGSIVYLAAAVILIQEESD